MTHSNAFAERVRAFGRPGSPDDSLVAVRVLKQLATAAVEEHRELIAMSEADQLLQGRLEQLLAAERLLDEVLIPEVRRAEGVPGVR